MKPIDRPRPRYCGANRRYGRGPCGMPALKGSWRCQFHGGRRIGRYHGGWPKSAHKRRATMLALYRALGITWPGGRPRKIEKVMSMAEQAKTVLTTAIVELEAALPPNILSIPVEELTGPQALGRASLSGSRQLVRIIEQQLDMENLKQQRLVGDMAGVALRQLERHAQGERTHDLIGKLLAALEAEKAPAEEK